MINGTTDTLSQMNPVLNAEIDWARHLPVGAPLTRVEHDRCAILLQTDAWARPLICHMGPDFWLFFSGSSHHGDFELFPNCFSAT
jgi:hypothetical protein